MRPTRAWRQTAPVPPQAPDPGPEPWEHVAPRRRRPLAALALGLAVLVALGVASRSAQDPAVLGIEGAPPGVPAGRPAPRPPGQPLPPLQAATGAVLPLPEPPLLPRAGHVAAGGGRRVIFWGGGEGELTYADGALLDLRTGAWQRLPDAPIADRTSATGVWTGRELLVWGGRNARSSALGDGAEYDVVARRWRRLPAAPLQPSAAHTATWTGLRMVVWGGQPSATGALYYPDYRRWERLPPAPIAPRSGHSATWTGDEVVIWGGQGTDGVLDDGAAYNPTTGRWRRLPPAPGRATGHVAVWTGRLLFVWGGNATDRFGFPIAGLLYDPAAGLWRVLPEPPVPVGNEPEPHAVWTGRRVIAWSGYPRATGGVFDPEALTWRPLGTFPGRIGRSALFTGGEMVVWGGANGEGATARGIRFRPDF